MSTSRFDVTSLGSTMVRLSVPSGESLQTASVLEVRTAGTESNTMAALTGMGMRTAWVSRLKKDALGHRIAREIRSHGVDVSGISWTRERRNELVFVQYGGAPRPTQVFYDRANSALADIVPEDVDLDFLLSSRILHLSGIFPALSDNCAAVINYVLEAAHKLNVKVSFDVNYRSKLWTTEKAQQVLSPIMQKVNILILTKQDAGVLFGIVGTPEQVVRACYETFHPEICVITVGADGGVAYDGTSIFACRGYDVEIRDRLGAGDCFAAGIICGILEGSLETGMNYASAMAALKLSINGDYFLFDREDVLNLLNRGQTTMLER